MTKHLIVPGVVRSSIVDAVGHVMATGMSVISVYPRHFRIVSPDPAKRVTMTGKVEIVRVGN